MMVNRIDFRVWGRFALFTDPLTRMGGEKCTYHVPTYEALKGIAKSVYWKPTFTWYIDRVRIMKKIRTQAKSVKPLEYGGGNSLAIYTYLADVAYQVQAHFEWNLNYPDLEHDRIDGKHFAVAKRMVEKGGRQDIFLGTRESQGYVEPCDFGEGEAFYDTDQDELTYGLVFHGFDYPDEVGEERLNARFWEAKMKAGIIEFPRPDSFPAPGEPMMDGKVRRFVRRMAMHKPLATKSVKAEFAEEGFSK